MTTAALPTRVRARRGDLAVIETRRMRRAQPRPRVHITFHVARITAVTQHGTVKSYRGPGNEDLRVDEQPGVTKVYVIARERLTGTPRKALDAASRTYGTLAGVRDALAGHLAS